MNPVLPKIVDLTVIDREAQALREQLALYPAMLAELDRLEAAAAAREAEAKERHKAARDVVRKSELDIGTLREQINKYILQQAQVKTNKEYHAITEEIQGVKTKIDALETKGIENVELEEQAQADIKKAQDELAALKKEHGAERDRIARQIADKEARLKELEAEHNARLAELPDELQEPYEILNQSYPGSAAAPVRDGGCGGCNTKLVSQRVLDAKLGERIVRCDNCNRILYDPASLGASKEA